MTFIPAYDKIADIRPYKKPISVVNMKGGAVIVQKRRVIMRGVYVYQTRSIVTTPHSVCTGEWEYFSQREIGRGKAL